MSKSYEVSGDTTEWEDILIKKGITTKQDVLMSKGLNPLEFMSAKELGLSEEIADILEGNANEEDRDKQLDKLNIDELNELEDDEEFADSSFFNEYRQKRMMELKKQQVQNRFGEVLEINKDEWIREVTECSKSCWVVAHLYQDSIVECRLLEDRLVNISKKFKYIKFVKIRSTQAVENWPENRLPTLFLYNEGELKLQLFTLKEIGGKTMTADDLEWWLVKNNVITSGSDLEEDPRSNN